MMHIERLKLSEAISTIVKKVQVVTKTLKLQRVSKNSNKRKLVISTNWLDLFLFTKGTLVSEDVIAPNKGMYITLADDNSSKPKKVYSRGYKNRPDETLMDIRNQSKLDEAMGDADHAHIVFTRGSLKITPIFNVQDSAVNEGININIHSDNGLYTGILKAINILKEKAYSSVSITGDEDFNESQEFVLISMQLRRLGYTVNHSESGNIQATLGEGNPLSTKQIDTSLSFIKDKAFNKIAPFDLDTPLSTFSCCTAGVDISSIESDGFSVKTLLDHRPAEARDFKPSKCKITGDITKVHSDKTEFGAISAAINAKAVEVVHSEDIYNFDFNRTSNINRSHNHFMISLQCCDFSNLKNKCDRLKAIETLDSTRDMIFPALDYIEKSGVPTLSVENVSNFATSVECALFNHRLKELGYTVHEAVLNAKDFNGYTKRNRSYIFASRLDEPFAFPQAVKQRTAHIWNDIIAPRMDELRDVTHTKSVQKAITSGRLRAINVGDEVGPTLTRSQSRQVKDSVYVKINDRFFMPSLDMLKRFMDIPLSFNTSLFSNEIGTEIIGQSVDIKMYSAISKAIKSHILGYADKLSQRSNKQMAFCF